MASVGFRERSFVNWNGWSGIVVENEKAEILVGPTHGERLVSLGTSRPSNVHAYVYMYAHACKYVHDVCFEDMSRNVVVACVMSHIRPGFENICDAVRLLI